MNIAEVGKATGLPAKTIRYYEDIGLVQPLRSDNGYRQFREKDLHKLAFVGRARSLGFSIEDCRALLALYEDRTRESREVHQIASEQLARVQAKIVELRAMEATLSQLVACCHNDDRPDCPILGELSGDFKQGL
jgi:MerR family transcriptional regulator, copper efflux regulator